MNREGPPKSQSQNQPVSEDGSADQLTRQNVEAILKSEKTVKQERTRSDLLAEAIARFCGSVRFIWVQVVWFGLWILINVMPGIKHFDPFPFTFLTFVISLEAIFLAIFILISRNQDRKISERRSHLALQINLLSEQENTKLIVMLQAIAARVGADLSHDPHLQALSEETEPAKLLDQIEEHEKE
jgi:uncharacterized membrane protein